MAAPAKVRKAWGWLWGPEDGLGGEELDKQTDRYIRQVGSCFGKGRMGTTNNLEGDNEDEDRILAALVAQHSTAQHMMSVAGPWLCRPTPLWHSHPNAGPVRRGRRATKDGYACHGP